MPILEDIKLVEAKAEEQKQNAVEEAKRIMEKAKETVNEKTKKMYQETEEKVKTMNQANEELIKQKNKEILATCENVNEKNKQLAEKNCSLVVDEIVRMVFEQ